MNNVNNKVNEKAEDVMPEQITEYADRYEETQCNDSPQSSKSTSQNKNSLAKTLAIFGIVIGVLFVLAGLFCKLGAEYSCFGFHVDEASFGADYYTMTYAAQKETVSALNGVNHGLENISESLCVIIIVLKILLMAAGALITSVNAKWLWLLNKTI